MSVAVMRIGSERSSQFESLQEAFGPEDSHSSGIAAIWIVLYVVCILSSVFAPPSAPDYEPMTITSALAR